MKRKAIRKTPDQLRLAYHIFPTIVMVWFGYYWFSYGPDFVDRTQTFWYYMASLLTIMAVVFSYHVMMAMVWEAQDE